MALIAIEFCRIGKNHPKCLQHLAGCPNGASIVPRPHLANDCNRGGQIGQGVKKWFINALQELTRIRRETFDVPSLAFCIERVQGQGGLAASADATDHR